MKKERDLFTLLKIYILHNKVLPRHGVVLKLACGASKYIHFLIEDFRIEVILFSLHFDEYNFVVQFVLGNYINLILTLSIPPAADACVRFALYKHTLEVLFKHLGTESLVVRSIKPDPKYWMGWIMLD